jgi:hypothetical protein
MAGVAGVELVYGFVKGVTWNTPALCGALSGFLSKPSGIKAAQGLSIDDSLGLFFSSDGTPTDIKVEGDLPVYLRYDGLDTLIAMVFGNPSGNITPVIVGAGPGYTYTLKPQKQTDGLFLTMVKNMKNYVAEIASLKVVGFTIKGDAGKPLDISFKCIGSMINNNTSSGTNTTTTIATITIPAKAMGDRVMFAQGVFWLGDYSTSVALSGSNVVSPSSFEFTFERNLAGVLGQFNTGGTNPRDVVDEPTNDGFPTIGLKLTFPRHTGVTRLTDLGANTKKMAQITFTGAAYTTGNRKMVFTFPQLQYKDVPIADTQGIIQEPVEFVCHSAPTAPAGMAGQTDPVWLAITAQQSTSPLA